MEHTTIQSGLTRQQRDKERSIQVHRRKKEDKNDVGFIYVITNKAFTGWCKVGITDNLRRRIGNYQTASPYRDYEYSFTWFVDDPRMYETEIKRAFNPTHEWIETNPLAVRDVILEVYRKTVTIGDYNTKIGIKEITKIIDYNRTNMKDHRTDFDCIT